jgi:hypothetical protein
MLEYSFSNDTRIEFFIKRCTYEESDTRCLTMKRPCKIPQSFGWGILHGEPVGIFLKTFWDGIERLDEKLDDLGR